MATLFSARKKVMIVSWHLAVLSWIIFRIFWSSFMVVYLKVIRSFGTKTAVSTVCVAYVNMWGKWHCNSIIDQKFANGSKDKYFDTFRLKSMYYFMYWNGKKNPKIRNTYFESCLFSILLDYWDWLVQNKAKSQRFQFERGEQKWTPQAGLQALADNLWLVGLTLNSLLNMTTWTHPTAMTMNRCPTLHLSIMPVKE